MNTPSNQTTPALTCKGCDHYGSIIRDHNPVTCCHNRKGAK